MSFLHRYGAKARQRAALIAAGVVLLAPALATAQGTTKPRKQAPETAETRARREAILEKIDSLRWHFEHERLSDEERNALRREMTTAFRELEETMVHVRAIEMEAAREARRESERSVRVMSRTPGAMMVTVGPGFRPRGYLGLSFDGANSEDVRNNELFVRFYQYPLIALVEPGSPAERGGIRKGDTLLALNGTDVVRGEVALSRMLVPDERITIRVRRDGDTKNVPVVVGRAPDYVVRRLIPPTAVAAPVPPRAVRTPDVPVAPAPAAFVWQYSDGIGGAKVETVDEGLGKALGVGSGVLVVRAIAGTPAYQSGLRGGDVIVRAAGKPVGTIRELRNALAWSESEDGVKLVVIRERKQQEVHFRW